jgi:hypothetical protein
MGASIGFGVAIPGPQLSVVDFEASPIGVLNARTTGSVTIDGG